MKSFYFLFSAGDVCLIYNRSSFCSSIADDSTPSSFAEFLYYFPLTFSVIYINTSERVVILLRGRMSLAVDCIALLWATLDLPRNHPGHWAQSIFSPFSFWFYLFRTPRLQAITSIVFLVDLLLHLYHTYIYFFLSLIGKEHDAGQADRRRRQANGLRGRFF